MKKYIIKAVSGIHPDSGRGFTHWVEINGEPVRMSQGGIITYHYIWEAEFAAKMKDHRLNRRGPRPRPGFLASTVPASWGAVCASWGRSPGVCGAA